MKNALPQALAIVALVGVAMAGWGTAQSAQTVPPGTTTILVATEAFVVTTDRTITVDLQFVTSSQLSGSVNVDDGSTAHVTITWRDPNLTIFSGTVVSSVRIRYILPPGYQVQDDCGHTEK